jgi:hypothetical protein
MANKIFLDCGCGCNGVIQEKKFLLAFIYMIFFLLFASPFAFSLTTKMFGISGNKALVLHAVLFLFAVWTTLNLRSEFMDGAMRPYPPPKAGGSVQKTMELPKLPEINQPWTDIPGKGLKPTKESMNQPWAEDYTLEGGPAPPAPPTTSNFLPSPDIPAIFSTSSKNTVGFEDADQPGGIIYAVV